LAQHSTDALPDVDSRNARFHSQGDGQAAQESAEEARLVSWSIYTRQAQKDAWKMASAKLRPQAERLLDIIAKNPFQSPPPYEKLIGDLAGSYFRRINIQHRLVYQVYRPERTIKVIRMWTHYE
jgi:Txe/YoeB family toxin of toxin-antitoxin system